MWIIRSLNPLWNPTFSQIGWKVVPVYAIKAGVYGYILSAIVNPKNALRKKMLAGYREFWGKDPGPARLTSFHNPKALNLIGKASAIEYVSNKWNGGGDGTKATYRHKFKNGAKLYMDEKGQKQLYILGSEIYADDRGIVN